MISPGFITREKREYAVFSMLAARPPGTAALGFEPEFAISCHENDCAPLHKVPQVLEAPSTFTEAASNERVLPPMPTWRIGLKAYLGDFHARNQ
jgi:hypothetical protein